MFLVVVFVSVVVVVVIVVTIVDIVVSIFVAILVGPRNLYFVIAIIRFVKMKYCCLLLLLWGLKTYLFVVFSAQTLSTRLPTLLKLADFLLGSIF